MLTNCPPALDYIAAQRPRRAPHTPASADGVTDAGGGSLSHTLRMRNAEATFGIELFTAVV
jgi:hypothetical protein